MSAAGLDDPRLKHLTPGERAALEKFLPAVRALLGPDLFEIRIFGSRARGASHEESDFDVALIVSDAGRAARYSVYDLASDIALDTGIPLAPTVIARSHLDDLRSRELGFAMNLDREGVPL